MALLFSNGSATASQSWLHFYFCCSQDRCASVVHGATDLQDHYYEQVQEETGAAHGLPEDVSFLWCPTGMTMMSLFHHKTTIPYSAAVFFTCCHRSRTLKDLNDVQLSKIIDSMEEVCIIQCWGLIVNFKSEMWKSSSSHILSHKEAKNNKLFHKFSFPSMHCPIRANQSLIWCIIDWKWLFSQVKYQDKDVIVREGAEANTFYIILKGEVMASAGVH